jgi:hypothetical protein
MFIPRSNQAIDAKRFPATDLDSQMTLKRVGAGEIRAHIEGGNASIGLFQVTECSCNFLYSLQRLKIPSLLRRRCGPMILHLIRKLPG